MDDSVMTESGDRRRCVGRNARAEGHGDGTDDGVTTESGDRR
jgi:hypothetical protein